jgi:hypothetical protein
MALAVSLATSRVVASRPVEVYMAVVGGGFLLLWLTILYVPGASYLFLLPAGVAAAGAWVVGVRPTWAALAAWAAVAALWLPLEPLFYDALGFMNRDVLVARLTLLVMAAYPVCVGSWPVASRAHGSVRPVRSTAAADPTGP